MPQLPNQASFMLDDKKNKGEANIIMNSNEIGFIHAQFDDPKAEFDLIIEDMAGNEQMVRRGLKNPTGRWGERFNLPITDNRLRVKVENVKGAHKLDMFFE